MTDVLAAATIPDAHHLRDRRGDRASSARSASCSARNPVHSALMLVMTLFGIAVLFVEEDAQFLAAVQIIVYAGAIVVLFLFVIMLLGVDRREARLADTLRGQRLDRDRPRVLRARRGAPPRHWALDDRCALGRPASSTARAPNVSVLGQLALHDLPAAVRSHLGAARRRGRRCRRCVARAPGRRRRLDPRRIAGSDERPRCRRAEDDAEPRRSCRRRRPRRRGRCRRRRRRGGGSTMSVSRLLVPHPRRGALHDRRDRPARPAQRARDVHVHRADAERRQPHLRHLRP